MLIFLLLLLWLHYHCYGFLPNESFKTYPGPRLPYCHAATLPRCHAATLPPGSRNWQLINPNITMRFIKCNTNIYSYLETCGCKSYNLHLNVVHFFNTSVNLWRLKKAVFLHWCLIRTVLLCHVAQGSLGKINHSCSWMHLCKGRLWYTWL